jgi:hypothetical protein
MVAVQGVIFVAIHQRLRELGDEELRRQCFPEGSSYLAFRDYPETDLVRIARAVADRVPTLAQSLPDVLRSLGEEVVATLKQSTPGILPVVGSLNDLVGMLGGEADPRLVLPRMRLSKEADGRVELLHLGDPTVCRFDEGLLIGLAAAFGHRVATRHPSCRGRRDPECIFVPRVVTGEGSGRPMSRTFRLDRPEDDGG